MPKPQQQDPIAVRGKVAAALTALPQAQSTSPSETSPKAYIDVELLVLALCRVALGHTTTIDFDIIQRFLDQEKANAPD